MKAEQNPEEHIPIGSSMKNLRDEFERKIAFLEGRIAELEDTLRE